MEGIPFHPLAGGVPIACMYHLVHRATKFGLIISGQEQRAREPLGDIQNDYRGAAARS